MVRFGQFSPDSVVGPHKYLDDSISSVLVQTSIIFLHSDCTTRTQTMLCCTRFALWSVFGGREKGSGGPPLAPPHSPITIKVFG